MYHALLTHRDIYFVAFDDLGNVIDTNYPVVSLNLSNLNDLIFLVGADNLSAIRDYISESGSMLQFSVANLHFEMARFQSSEDDIVFCLQIEAKDALADAGKLSAIERDYQLITELSASISVLNDSGGAQMSDDLKRDIEETHLPEVKAKLGQLEDPSLKLCLEIIQTNMETLLTEPDVNNQLLSVLTPSEFQVAEFIRSGMSSQEIANTLNVAKKTVENHRNSLRNKLGITNRGVNLRNYLQTLETK
ncbi:helix-turn-helix transcriptional regulator [Veronia nyctiphanis]|uniref:Helix-turn-helix transcriptional regulator n=1 Tax=Veronia nyctiphanis TaxID=1278244 RepID=A0A4Q0YKU6_9GAMM|nr:helix-turn-helix transcriptional regulator [Veronia nyctiphanis]RXJ70624.1 helix-turn-helix transcriptional regulator [Veronia nyctiphanis]